MRDVRCEMWDHQVPSGKYHTSHISYPTSDFELSSVDSLNMIKMVIPSNGLHSLFLQLLK
jgi:hypothetical protein